MFATMRSQSGMLLLAACVLLAAGLSDAKAVSEKMGYAVVTGANRGIGLALCRELKSRGVNVIGTCRTASPELQALGVTIVEGVDVGYDGGTDALAEAIADKTVDLVICNAGITRSDTLETVQPADIRDQFEVNALGPLRTFLAVKDRMRTGGKIIIISSKLAAFSGQMHGSLYGYRMSKVAANMLGFNMAADLEDYGVAVAMINPGFVSTDMTAKFHGKEGMISPEDAAKVIVEIIQNRVSMDTTGSFFNRDGTILQW